MSDLFILNFCSGCFKKTGRGGATRAINYQIVDM